MKKPKKEEIKRVPWSMAAPFLKKGWKLKGMVGGANNAFVAVLVKPKKDA